MIIERFLIWIQTAEVSKRVQATRNLTKAYLYSEMSLENRETAESALTLLLEDSSPKVRLALAESLGSSQHAPHHLVSMLARDQIKIATTILLRSPVFLDTELIEIIEENNLPLQIAIACRPFPCSMVEKNIAEKGRVETCIALLMNKRLNLGENNIFHIARRYGSNPDVRNLLLEQKNLPANIRSMLINSLGEKLKNFVVSCNWLSEQRAEKIVFEACDRAIIEYAHDLDHHQLCKLVNYIIGANRMNAAFLLRTVCSGNISLFNISLSILSNVALNYVKLIITEGNETAFQAVYNKSGLPSEAFTIFLSAMTSWCLANQLRGEFAEAKLPNLVIQEVLKKYKISADTNIKIVKELTNLLHKLAVEAACDSAKAHIKEVVQAA